MAESPRGKPTGRSGSERASGERPGGERASRDTLPPLSVRYYKRMRLQRVYALVVGWSREGGRAPVGTPPVTLRLLMAGAQVVPAEHALDAADPDAKATFYVTPLAKGWLRNERLEILVGDRKVQELPLPAKVTSQRLALALVLLAFLLPWFVLSYGKYSPLQMTRADIDKKDLEEAINRALTARPDGLDKKGKKHDNAAQMQKAKDAILHGEKPLGELADDPQYRFLLKTPGEVLSGRIARETPDLPDFAKGSGEKSALEQGLEAFRGKIGTLYDNFIEWNRRYPIAFYVFVGFLLLALVAFVVNQDKRRRRLSKPIPLPRAAGEAGHSRREELAAVEVE